MRIAVVLTVCAACATDAGNSGMTGPATLAVDNVETTMSAGLFPTATTQGQNPGYWGWTVGFFSTPPGDCHSNGGHLKGELEVVTSTFSTSASDVKIPVGTMLITKNLPVPLTNPVALVWAANDVVINLDAGSVTISMFTSATMDGNFSGTGTDSTNATVTVTGTFSARRCE